MSALGTSRHRANGSLARGLAFAGLLAAAIFLALAIVQAQPTAAARGGFSFDGGSLRERPTVWPTSTLPELVMAFIDAGLQELSRREVAASAKSAADAASKVVIIAGLTLVFAIITLIVAIAK
jgi:hypothetical protein